MREVPNLMPAPTVKYRDPTDVVSTGTGNLSYGEDIMPNNKSNEVADPLPEIQANVKMKLQKMIHLEEEKHPFPSYLSMTWIWKRIVSSWKPKTEMELSGQPVTQVLISF